MQIYSIIAIYALFWVISGFIILPLGIKSNEELGIEPVKGQADGAPGNFKPLRTVLATTALATIGFGLFYLNYNYEWITVDDVDFFNSRAR
jgi:predicted secreted protein